jgi:crotonobetainyl-CoA:carnitine CoA-transferase CaiB-like acyl-CoA transferase
MVVELDHRLAGKLKMVGPLVKMSETPLSARAASPALGEHVDEILDSLGYSQERIRQLRDMGVTR